MAGRETARLRGSDFIVCILGEIYFQREFERYAGRELKQTKLEIRSIENADDAGSCHVMVLGKEVATSKTLLSGLRDFACLTVGEAKGWSSWERTTILSSSRSTSPPRRAAGFSIGADLLSLAVVLNAN